MAIINQIKNELNQLGIKPKKSLGQNFLINESVYAKIVAALDIKPGGKILEVGPGLGTLTQYLAGVGAEVIAVEKDHMLTEYLKIKFANEKRVKIIEDDILKFNPADYSLQTTHYKLVGNIPYYLTSHLLRTVFENWPMPESVVLMLQKEVAQRICAKPPNMSLLAVSVQYYARPKIISYVSKNSFWPSPEVDSAVIKFEPKAIAYHLAPSTFFRIVRAGFAGKRKQLGNNLARELKLTKNFVEEKLKSIGVDPIRRAETLTLEEWGTIANTFLPH
jgi:16S rRNA (adenine1518-N6/adenine1519-N6)-dimethyltransferase